MQPALPPCRGCSPPIWWCRETLVDLSLQRLQDRSIAALVLDVDRTMLPRHRPSCQPRPSSGCAVPRRGCPCTC